MPNERRDFRSYLFRGGVEGLFANRRETFLSPLESILAHRRFLFFNQCVIRSFYRKFRFHSRIVLDRGAVQRKLQPGGKYQGWKTIGRKLGKLGQLQYRDTQTYRRNLRNFHEGSGISRWRIFAYRIRRKKIEIWELVYGSKVILIHKEAAILGRFRIRNRFADRVDWRLLVEKKKNKK